MSFADPRRGWLSAILASFLIAPTAARAGTAITSFGGNGGIIPGAAPHLSGYVVASQEQGNTSAKYSVLSVNQTTHQVSVTGGDRLYSNNNTLPVYTQCAPSVIAKDAFNAYILMMETNPGAGDPARAPGQGRRSTRPGSTPPSSAAASRKRTSSTGFTGSISSPRIVRCTWIPSAPRPCRTAGG
jgi:hypothetical protein